MTLQPVIIGLDASTTACKAIAYEADGAAVAEGRQGLALLHPRSARLRQPDWHEQSADAWWEAAASALRQVSSQIESSRLAALCISHQRESFVPLDAEMRPLRHAIIWIDERSRELLPALEAQLDPETFHRLTGRPLTANLVTGKIAWLRRYEPEVFAHARYYADTHAYLALQLTGELRTGWGSADPTGLFATMERRWADAVLAVLDLRGEQLPELHPPGAVIGAVTQGAAAQTGLPAGLPVVCGLGDGQAAGLGANITAPGPAYLNLGTAVVTGTYSEDYLTDRAFRTTCGGIPNSYLLETVLLGGTYTLSWFAEMMAPDAGDDEQSRLATYETKAASVPAGAEGLMLLPYWNSAMNPYWDAAASGLVIGWRGHHDRRHLYRAILEGVAYEVRLHIEGVEAATGRPVTELIAMGGGSRSALWRQIIADVTGKRIRRCGTPEASALGAAMLGAAGVGIHPGVREAAETMTRLDAAPTLPDPERREAYSRLYEEVYRLLFPALRTSMRRLGALG